MRVVLALIRVIRAHYVGIPIFRLFTQTHKAKYYVQKKEINS